MYVCGAVNLPLCTEFLMCCHSSSALVTWILPMDEEVLST